MGGSRLSGHPDFRFLPSNAAVHLPVEATARAQSAADLRQRCQRIFRYCARKDGRQVAGVVSGNSLSFEGTFLSRRAGRSNLRAAIPRRLPLPHLVVWRVAGSARRRSFADNQREIGVPSGAALELVLAGSAREGLCEVSFLQHCQQNLIVGKFRFF